MLAVRVRRSKIDAAKGALGELKRVVERIRARWPGVRITVRGDSGFCRDRIMAWCEGEEGIRYVFGLARNPRLQRRIAEDLEAAKAACAESGEASCSFRELRYRTLDSWSASRTHRHSLSLQRRHRSLARVQRGPSHGAGRKHDAAYPVVVGAGVLGEMLDEAFVVTGCGGRGSDVRQ